MALGFDVLASYVQDMLSEMLKGEVHMLLGVPGEIKKMDVNLRHVKNILMDAEGKIITDETTKALVAELKNAMYDATNIIDLCNLNAPKQSSNQHTTSCFNPLLFCLRNPLHAHDIGTRIKDFNKKFESIMKRSSIDLRSYENRSTQKPYSRETTGYLNKLGVVGDKIEEDTRNLVNMLVQAEETLHGDRKKNIMVVAIVGVGGIGKTTLAQKIFNDDDIQSEFTKKMWLSVNKQFEPNDLLRRAIGEAGGAQEAAGTTSSKSQLQGTLMEALKGCKTLLVMDDVWDYHAWEDVLETPLTSVLARGSCVLVTTRHDMVARGMKAKGPYHRVDRLQPQDAWSLLKMQVHYSSLYLFSFQRTCMLFGHSVCHP